MPNSALVTRIMVCERRPSGAGNRGATSVPGFLTTLSTARSKPPFMPIPGRSMHIQRPSMNFGTESSMRKLIGPSAWRSDAEKSISSAPFAFRNTTSTK